MRAPQVGDTAPYAATTYLMYNVLPANLTAVTLSASLPSPQITGRAITFSATVYGGITAPNVQYQFVAQYKNSDGSWAPNILLQDWSTWWTCLWTPTTAQYFYVNVYARPVGDTAPYAATTYLTYNVLPTTLTGVTLAASPVCATVYRDADYPHRDSAGRITYPNVQYQFTSQYKLANGSWSSDVIIGTGAPRRAVYGRPPPRRITT